MSGKRSIKGETEKAIRFHNLIREIADDIFKLPSDKKRIEEMGDILGVICVTLRMNGIERFGSPLIDIGRYLEHLEMEYNKMMILFKIRQETGDYDMFEISRNIFKKIEEKDFGTEKS